MYSHSLSPSPFLQPEKDLASALAGLLPSLRPYLPMPQGLGDPTGLGFLSQTSFLTCFVLYVLWGGGRGATCLTYSELPLERCVFLGLCVPVVYGPVG